MGKRNQPTLPVSQNWSDTMKTRWALNTQPTLPGRKFLEFWCYTGRWETRSKLLESRKKFPQSQDLPEEKNCFKYMTAHSLWTFANFKVLWVGRRVTWKMAKGKSWIFSGLQGWTQTIGSQAKAWESLP